MKKKLLSYTTFLLLVSALLRLVVYLMLPPAKEWVQYSPGQQLFFSALVSHFGDYVSSSTQIPPLNYLVHAGVLSVAGIETALHVRAFLVLVFIMDIAAVWLLYKSAVAIFCNRRMSFVLVLLFSITLVPFELWQEGMHYDHLTIFFVSFFLWSIVNFYKQQKSIRAMIIMSLSGMLLLTQSAVSSVVVPVSVFIITSLLFIPTKQYRVFFMSIIIMLLLPFAALLMISLKNQQASGEMLTSNKGGPAMMMVVQRAYNYDAAAVRNAAQKAGAPEWYLWSYDNATSPIDVVTGKPYDHWGFLSQAFGTSFFSDSLSSIHQSPWLFDFTKLASYLRKSANDSLLTAVLADSADVINRPYRFAGYSPELSPRWVGIYGDVSKKIFFRSLINNPSGMLKAVVIQHGIFSLYGPLFPYNTVNKEKSALTRSGLRSLPEEIPLSGLFRMVTLFFAIINWIMYAIILLSIPFSIFKMVIKKKGFSKTDIFRILSIPVIGTAIIFSCLVGGENDRYFMQITPYIVVLACYLSTPKRKRQQYSSTQLG